MEHLVRALVRELITASTNQRMVSILESGNELVALLPKGHPNRQIVRDVAYEMHQAAHN